MHGLLEEGCPGPGGHVVVVAAGGLKWHEQRDMWRGVFTPDTWEARCAGTAGLLHLFQVLFCVVIFLEPEVRWRQEMLLAVR